MGIMSHRFKDSLPHRRFLGRDKTGSPQFADPETLRCRFQYDSKLILNREGEEVVSEAVLYSDKPVKPNDLVTYDGIEWAVISAAEKKRVNGAVDHWEARM